MCTHMYVERSQSDRCMLKIYIYTCSPCQSLAAYGNSQISPVCMKKHVTWNECLWAEISNAYFVNALLSSEKKKKRRSETRMTACIRKQNLTTWKVQKNTYLIQYKFIAKCQYNCMRNVLWCRVHKHDMTQHNMHVFRVCPFVKWQNNT